MTTPSAGATRKGEVVMHACTYVQYIFLRSVCACVSVCVSVYGRFARRFNVVKINVACAARVRKQKARFVTRERKKQRKKQRLAVNKMQNTINLNQESFCNKGTRDAPFGHTHTHTQDIFQRTPRCLKPRAFNKWLNPIFRGCNRREGIRLAQEKGCLAQVTRVKFDNSLTLSRIGLN